MIGNHATLVGSLAEQSLALKDLVAEQQVQRRRLERELADVQATAHQAVCDLERCQERLAIAEGRLFGAVGVRRRAEVEAQHAAQQLLSACRAALHMRRWQRWPHFGAPVCPVAAHLVSWILEEWSPWSCDPLAAGERLLHAVIAVGWLRHLPEALRFQEALAELDRLRLVQWVRDYEEDVARTEAYSA